MTTVCTFCAIVAGRAPATITREWDDAIALVPLGPVTAGHLLVVPRRHVEHAATDPEVAAAVARHAAELAAEAGDSNLITSVGPAATATVSHLHLHLVPRRAGDGLPLPWTPQHSLIALPDLLGDTPVLVTLIGPPGAGKSTLVRHWLTSWPATCVQELDGYRAVVSDDAGDQTATSEAVALFHQVLDARLRRKLTTVVDMTSTRADVRVDLVQRAHRHGVPAVAVVLTTPVERCVARNARRPANRCVPEEIVRRMHAETATALAGLAGEGFDRVYVHGAVPAPAKAGGSHRE